MKSRESRKIDHIKYAVHLEDGPRATGFSDVQVMHRCLPQVDRRKVDLSTSLPGVGILPHPLVIDAITGGAEKVTHLNRKLALIARETGCPMAVGSQYGAVRSGEYADTYKVVREENPDGVIFANVSALATPEEARRAVDMVEAQALEIHLNSAQELAMEEGDRDFSHWLEQIAAICEQSEVPVIVKETGCGMEREDARRLLDCGVSILDTGGAGGTNFPAIECCRNREGNKELIEWGIPSALSLLEVVEAKGWQKGIIASGGIRTALDVFKAQMLGANAVGMTGNILRFVRNGGGPQRAIDWIRQLLEAVKDFYTLTGCTRVEDLRQVRYYVTGNLAAAVRTLPYGEK